jgi:hypothetical protein
VPNPSPWPGVLSDGAALLVVGRYRVADPQRRQFLADADRAIDALAAQSGFLRGSIGQAVDESDLFVIRTEWAGVGAYRRALSAFDVKVNAVPLLSTAVDESSAFEVVHDWFDGRKASAPSGLAADAGEIGLGDAAAPVVPPVPS